MTVKGVTIGPLLVGWHLKGAWGSWVGIDQKPGVKIKVDAFVEDQTIFGVKKLILNNMWQEGSALNQQLTMKLFRAMNVPASRTGYTLLTINEMNYGLYTVIESLDRISLARWFPTTKHLYKGGVPNHWADLVPWEEWALQVETGSKLDRSDLTPFLAANVANNWWTEINKVADMQEMVREWVVELMTGHWDGYTINGNNYYLHVDEAGKFSMLPWGVDQTWQSTFDYETANKTMSQKCLNSNPCKILYYQAVADATYAIDSLDLDQMARDIAARINPVLAVEPGNRRNWDYWSTLGAQSETLQGLARNAQWPKDNIWEFSRPRIERYDSALLSLTVAGQKINLPVADNTLEEITVPAGTASVVVTAVTRQTGATKVVTGTTALSEGVNVVSVVTTSPNALSTQRYELRVNVPRVPVRTSMSKSLAVTFTAKGALTPTSIQAVRKLAQGIRAADGLEVKVEVRASILKRATRFKTIVSQLKSNGMPTPISSKHLFSKPVKANQMRVTISYVVES
jgi:hypothetical protein